MEWILVTGYLFLFIAFILRAPAFKLESIPRSWLAWAFTLKVIAGISLGLIYKYYYADKSTADTYKFFNDSNVIFDSLFSNPYDFFRMLTGYDGSAPELRSYYLKMDAWLNTDVLFNDNKTIIRLNVLFHFFSLGKYYVHVVFLNFISFIGLFCILKTFSRYIPQARKILFVSTFLLPSVLFWGSGLLKDGLLIFALGLLLYSFDRILSKEQLPRNLVIFGLSFLLLIFTKLYVLICIFPGIVAWYWARNNQGWKVILKFSVCYFVYLLFAFNLYHLSPKYDIADIIYWKQKNFYALAEATNAQSVIQIPSLDYGVKSILANAPVAFFNTLFRPFPGDIKGNKLILLSAVENLFMLSICFACIYYRKKKPEPLSPVITFSIFFVVFMFVLSGLITPILGALVRYRVPALPFLLFIFLSLVDWNRVKSRMSRIISDYPEPVNITDIEKKESNSKISKGI